MKNIFPILMCIIIFCTACGNSHSETFSASHDNSSTKTGNENNVVSSLSPDDVNELYSYAENLFQPYWGLNNNAFIKKVEGGYYYIYNDLLCYFDTQNNLSTPLCSTPGCTHEDETCSAFVGLYGDDYQYGFNTMGFEIYDNQIYIIGTETSETCDFYIYRMNMNGTERTKLFYLYSAEPDEHGFVLWDYSLIMHDGYFYGVINYDNDISLSRIDTSGKTEKIFDLNDKYATNIEKICAYGEYVYFEANWYDDKELTQYHAYLYRYNTVTGDIENIADNLQLNGNNFFLINESQILYMNMDFDILIYDFTAKETVSVIYSEGSFSEFAYDGLYIYVQSENSDGLTVFDTDGNVVDSFECGDYSCLFGDFEYLFCTSFSNLATGEEYETDSIWALDKSQIGSDDKEWIKLESN